MNDCSKIPNEQDWENWQDDLDTKYAHNLLAGKTIQNVVDLFLENPIERMDELIWVPKSVFQYYIYGFVKAVHSKEAAGNSELASAFLNLLIAKEKQTKGSVAEIFNELMPTIKFVADNQNYFDASIEIFGAFTELESELIKLCGENIGS